MKQQTNCMIDLETLGVSPGCAILSVAAVPFGFMGAERTEPFYQRIQADSCYKAGLVAEDSTVAWWRRQSCEAYAEAFSGDKSVYVVASSLSEYIRENLGKDVCVWGNGADFDLPILAFVYRKLGLEVPWKYTNGRCYRTLRNLVPFKAVKPKIPHHALYDAISQAEHATSAIAFLSGKQSGDLYAS